MLSRNFRSNTYLARPEIHDEVMKNPGGKYDYPQCRVY